MKKINCIDDLRGLVCDVLGIGISNLPLIELLCRSCAIVRARDVKSEDKLGECAKSLRALGVKLILGENYLEEIDGDIIFRSPGIRPDLPQITRAIANGALLLSEMELFFILTKARLIGITGSDGKTTTTTLTHLFIKKQLRLTLKECITLGLIVH